MKKLLFSSIVLLLLTLNGQAQTAPRQATARICESFTKEYARIVLVSETGVTEIIALQPKKYGAGNYDDKAVIWVENQKTITKMLNNMDAKGYDLAKNSYVVDANGDEVQYLYFTKRN